MNPLPLLKLVPLRAWLYLAGVIALFGGYAWWTHHQRAIGEAACEERHTKDLAAIKALQDKIDAKAAAQNAPVIARYDYLTEADATYDRTPIAIAGCDRLPDYLVRNINASHARKNL